MGFWPFGGGKRQKAQTSIHNRDQSLQSDPSEKMGRLEKQSTDISGRTKASSGNAEDNRMRRWSKTRDLTQSLQQKSQTAPIAIPGPKRLTKNNTQQLSEKALYHQNPTSQSSLGPENFTVIRQPPTLYAKRPDNDAAVVRRKSSKRKAEDYAREREVRAMSSSPMTTARRPASFYGSPLERETKDIPGGLNRKLQRPASQVSLPIPETLSDVENAPFQHSFRVGTFAALSPRPTIKYDSRPQQHRGKQRQRPNPLIGSAIFEEIADADKKRIDELADDLDAGGLRELMERDKRRKERKKLQDRAKLERKLQRRADKQREDDARKSRTEEYVSASASRIRGLGIEPDSANQTTTDDTKAGPSGGSAETRQDPFADPKYQTASPAAIRNPFEDEKDMDLMQDSVYDEDTGPAVPNKSPLRTIKTEQAKVDAAPSQAAISPPASPVPRLTDRQSLSQGSLLNREPTTEIPENASLTGAASDHSSQRLSNWTAFFRRGTRRKLSASFQGRSTPSEFSNTSRESFARKQPQPIHTQRTFRRADSATPQRTMSKFREDLPEFPISPPDSRLQSPEASSRPHDNVSALPATDKRAEAESQTIDIPAMTPSSPIPASRVRAESASAMDIDPPSSGKPQAILSQSLASVDSEGSWLSGRPLNRRSGASQKLKPSRSSLTRSIPGAFGGDDSPAMPQSPVQQEGEDAIATSAAEKNADETWHTGVGRQPTLVSQASRAKSREGLLNEYVAKERQDSSPDTEDADDDEANESGEPEVTLMRARSIDYKGHARHVSAGSAKILDIRRSSTHSEDLLTKAGQEQATKETSLDH